jgi:hypothetical protein
MKYVYVSGMNHKPEAIKCDMLCPTLDMKQKFNGGCHLSTEIICLILCQNEVYIIIYSSQIC